MTREWAFARAFVNLLHERAERDGAFVEGTASMAFIRLMNRATLIFGTPLNCGGGARE